MKKSRTLIVLVILILIFSGILFLPMFIVYGGFGLLDPFAIRERYSLDYYIYLESYEPFENVTLLVPTAKLGSEELTPTNAETVKIGNRTYIKLNRDKPFSEIHRIWDENKTTIVYRMDFTVKFPRIKIKNLNKYRMDDGNVVEVFLNYTNASYVKLYIVLYYLEFDYVDIFGKRLYTNFGHYNYPWCDVTVNITENEKGKWIEVPVACLKHQ